MAYATRLGSKHVYCVLCTVHCVLYRVAIRGHMGSSVMFYYRHILRFLIQPHMCYRLISSFSAPCSRAVSSILLPHRSVSLELPSILCMVDAHCLYFIHWFGEPGDALEVKWKLALGVCSAASADSNYQYWRAGDTNKLSQPLPASLKTTRRSRQPP